MQVFLYIKSLFAFAKRGEVAKFKGALKMAFIVMSQQISRDNKRYTIRCEKNKQIAIEREEQRRADRRSELRILGNDEIHIKDLLQVLKDRLCLRNGGQVTRQHDIVQIFASRRKKIGR